MRKTTGAAMARPQVETATKKVDDPYVRHGRLFVDVNINESPLERLYAHRKLSPARYAVGTRYRALYERSTVGSIQAIRYDRPMIDGAVPGDPLSDALIDATRQLARLHRAVGQESASFLAVIVGQGQALAPIAADYARAYRMTSRGAVEFVRGRLVESLDAAGRFWGMVEAKGRPSVPIRAERDVTLTVGALDFDEEIATFDLRENSA